MTTYLDFPMTVRLAFESRLREHQMADVADVLSGRRPDWPATPHRDRILTGLAKGDRVMRAAYQVLTSAPRPEPVAEALPAPAVPPPPKSIEIALARLDWWLDPPQERITYGHGRVHITKRMKAALKSGLLVERPQGYARGTITLAGIIGDTRAVRVAERAWPHLDGLVHWGNLDVYRGTGDDPHVAVQVLLALRIARRSGHVWSRDPGTPTEALQRRYGG